MTEREFVRFREMNDHEGETWTWWLLADGNDDALAKLAGLLSAAEDDDFDSFDEFPFQLSRDDREPEWVVDKLVEYAEDGYYSTHNKVEGTFTCPDSLGEHCDVLYKGGIRYVFAAGAVHHPGGGTQ